MTGLIRMRGIHNKIIADTAKAALRPLGCRQVGRSRPWIADRGAWLNVLEFTPKRWSKGVSLMNAAHWLWTSAGFMSFNEAISSNLHADFETEDQFRRAMGDIAATARATAADLDVRFASFTAINDFVVQRARNSPDQLAPSWRGYEAGITLAISGRSEEARQFFDRLTDERVLARAACLMPLVDDPARFRQMVNEIVAEERARLKVEPLANPAF